MTVISIQASLSDAFNEPPAADTSLQECVNNILQVNGKLKLFL